MQFFSAQLHQNIIKLNNENTQVNSTPDRHLENRKQQNTDFTPDEDSTFCMKILLSKIFKGFESKSNTFNSE